MRLPTRTPGTIVRVVRRETADERREHARLAARASWDATEDRSERTRPAREAALRRFEAQVDPDGVLDRQERRERALEARRRFLADLNRMQAQCRRIARERSEQSVG